MESYNDFRDLEESYDDLLKRWGIVPLTVSREHYVFWQKEERKHDCLSFVSLIY